MITLTNDSRDEVIAKIEIETVEVISDHQRERIGDIRISAFSLDLLRYTQTVILRKLANLDHGIYLAQTRPSGF